MGTKICNEKCNECPIIQHPNSKMITLVLNKVVDKFGDDVIKLINDECPNLTCCYDCRVDDFCHIEGCRLTRIKKVNRKWEQKLM